MVHNMPLVQVLLNLGTCTTQIWSCRRTSVGVSLICILTTVRVTVWKTVKS